MEGRYLTTSFQYGTHFLALNPRSDLTQRECSQGLGVDARVNVKSDRDESIVLLRELEVGRPIRARVRQLPRKNGNGAVVTHADTVPLAVEVG